MLELCREWRTHGYDGVLKGVTYNLLQRLVRRAGIIGEFPNLRQVRFSLESDPTIEYNCIAWAAGETHRRWWPFNAYWPNGAARELTLEAFIAAFATLRYEPCDSGILEDGFEKVAIYVRAGSPKHMARQLEDGQWASKLGNEDDIYHETLDGVEGYLYGTVVQFMRRMRT